MTSAAGRKRSGLIRRLTSVAAVTVIAIGALTVAVAPAQAAGTYRTTGTVSVRSGPGTSYGITGTSGASASFVLLCQWQNGTSITGNSTWDYVQFTTGFVGAISDYWTTTPSWNSFAPGTGACPASPSPAPAPVGTAQMRQAVNWAVAEKNSPDPTWSDHYGHAWSGWCEQFAEQAEGFTFRFGSAQLHYNWQQANGRIHTDTNPPAGALVFYGGASGNGHIAVSIGGGQAIGTLGYVGQRLRVSQYPIVGYLSNPYLGWALPIGS